LNLETVVAHPDEIQNALRMYPQNNPAPFESPEQLIDLPSEDDLYAEGARSKRSGPTKDPQV
jgi:hypothetical protein